MLSIDDLAGRRFAEPALDDTGRPTEPLVVVDLGSPAGNLYSALDAVTRLSGRSSVVIGVASEATPPAVDALVEALDLTISPEGGSDPRVLAAPVEPTIAAMAMVASVAPRAAVALAGLLRLTTQLPVEDGLLAESFAYSTLQAGPEFAAWRAGRVARTASEPPTEVVRVDRDGAALRITLDEPARHNAFSVQMRDGLVEALLVAEVDQGIEVVHLAGEGPSFCSGGDLDQFGTSPDPASAHLVRTAQSAALLVHALRDRVEVRVHGSCVGAGVELPAFAGRVVATRDASFLLPEVAMGLVPGAGGTVSITRRIGRWRTLAMALLAEPVDAQMALDWGLIDAIDHVETT